MSPGGEGEHGCRIGVADGGGKEQKTAQVGPRDRTNERKRTPASLFTSSPPHPTRTVRRAMSVFRAAAALPKRSLVAGASASQVRSATTLGVGTPRSAPRLTKCASSLLEHDRTRSVLTLPLPPSTPHRPTTRNPARARRLCAVSGRRDPGRPCARTLPLPRHSDSRSTTPRTSCDRSHLVAPCSAASRTRCWTQTLVSTRSPSVRSPCATLKFQS